MAFSLPNIFQIAAKGVETFKRFPLALLSSLITTLIVIYFIHAEPHVLEGMNLILAKVATTAMLGAFVFTALRLLEYSQIDINQILLSALGFLGLVVYYLTLPDDMGGFDAWIYLLRHIFLIILFFVTILWTPFVKSHLPNSDYWQYAKEVLFALMMTVLFSIVVIVGVNTALYAVEELFDLYIKGKYYFMIDVLIVGVFSVAYFLSQIPNDPLSSKARLQPPRVEKFFTQYILTPLSLLYFVILYLYTAKVLVSMDWPKGILAWLIVAFSVVAVLTYLFWTHFANAQGGRWRRWIWLAIFLQTLMLFIAIGMRIDAYSWTENRYMVLLLGIWLAGISLYFLFFKTAKIKWIFISLSLLIGISQVGPFSAYAVSKSAQTSRLHTALESMKKENLSASEIPIKVRYEISDITLYLYNRYGIDIFVPIFPKITAEYKNLDKQRKEIQKRLRENRKKSQRSIAAATKKDSHQIDTIFKGKPHYFPHFVAHVLGFKFVDAWQYNNARHGRLQNIHFYVRHSQNKSRIAQDIRGYDYMVYYHGDAYEERNSTRVKPYGNFESIGVDVSFEKAILTIKKESALITFDIRRYIEDILKEHGQNATYLSQKDLTLEKENDTLRVKIEFQNLNKNHYKDTKTINFNSHIFFKFKGEK